MLLACWVTAREEFVAFVEEGVVIEDVGNLEFTVVCCNRREITDSAEEWGRDDCLTSCACLVSGVASFVSLSDRVFVVVVRCELELVRVNSQIDQLFLVCSILVSEETVAVEHNWKSGERGRDLVVHGSILKGRIGAGNHGSDTNGVWISVTT
jgi:hypothetical protein